MKLKLIQTRLCNYYLSDKNEMYMTRRQVGEALGYANPRDTIKRKHLRNREQFDQSSKRVKLSGKPEETVIYSKQGILRLIVMSNKPETNELFDYIYSALAFFRQKEQLKETAAKAKRLDEKTHLVKVMIDWMKKTHVSSEVEEQVMMKAIEFLTEERF
ncbi:BRO family protein [Shouchella lonarensis]|uniref:Prophage antirepressor n=1 Tax=Shouchella lonarensis TaxID=1464122 RepID=A0A1G6HU09_9BACI|nr:BRO family protein [Shouchella lonarensis]SDB96956.1 Prophage antirepressor [Shouchella lonarensis]